MRIFLIWLVLVGGCFGQIKPTGVATWVDTVAGTSHGAFGPAGVPTLCYQDDQDEWHFIDDNFEQVGESQTWKSTAGNHRVFADSSGAAIYAVGDHYLGTETTHLIKFNTADSSWEILAVSDPDSVTTDGNRITFWGLFPGVDKQLQNNPKVFRRYNETFIFSQAAREWLAGEVPWSKRLLGTVTKLDVDSLNLSLSDIAGQFDIDTLGRLVEDWVKFSEGEATAFWLAKSYLQCVDSTAHSIPVHKFLVKKSGNFYLVELFSAITANQLPDGTIWHNATFGYFTESGDNYNCEDYIRLNLNLSSGGDGNIDSITAYMWVSAAARNTRLAVYVENGSDWDLLDTTAEFSVTSAIGEWYSNPAEIGAAVTSSGNYACAVWSDAGGGYCYIEATFAAADWEYISLDYANPWEDPIADASLTDAGAYQAGLYCTWTAGGAPTPTKPVFIYVIVNMLNVIIRGIL